MLTGVATPITVGPLDEHCHNLPSNREDHRLSRKSAGPHVIEPSYIVESSSSTSKPETFYRGLVEPSLPSKLAWQQGLFGRTHAFHAVNLTLKAIWLITPLSFCVLGASLFLMISHRSVLPLPMTAAILSTTEVISAICQRYSIRRAKRYTSICALEPERRDKFGHDIMHTDLRVRAKEREGGLEVTVAGDEEGASALEDLRSEEESKEATMCSSMCCSGALTHDLTLSSLERAMMFRQKFSKWFGSTSWAEIRRNDVLIWLSSVFLNVPLNQALRDREKRAFLCKIFVIVEARSATTFARGRSPSVDVMRISLDPMNAIPRPLIIYTINNAVNYVIRNAYLPLRGMSQFRQGDIDYLLRIPPGWTPEAGRSDPSCMPLMYMHGMGFGLIQNVKVLEPMLYRFKTHPILFPIAHHTCQAVFHRQHLRPWTRQQFVRDMAAICERWGFDAGRPTHEMASEPKCGEPRGGLSVMSHSNGTVHHSWMLQDCPQLVRRNTFVDPIIFCLEEGFTCHAFCYRAATTPFQLIMQKLVSSELGISNYIQRHFHWSDNCIFIEEHPHLLDHSTTHFFLGSKDVIVDAPRVKEYLESHGAAVGVNLTWDNDGGHGKALRARGGNLGRVLDCMVPIPFGGDSQVESA